MREEILSSLSRRPSNMSSMDFVPRAPDIDFLSKTSPCGHTLLMCNKNDSCLPNSGLHWRHHHSNPVS